MITGNEPAMPFTTDADRDTELHEGLTIRQHFAAMAMQGLFSNHLMVDQFGCGDALAAEAVKIADSLIAELNKNN